MTFAPAIDMTATGAYIKALIKSWGLKVADIQAMCGDALPTIDNMVILAHMLDVTIDQIIIINGIHPVRSGREP